MDIDIYVPNVMNVDTDHDIEDAVEPADRNRSRELPDSREDLRLMDTAVNGGFVGRTPNLDTQVTEGFSKNEIDRASQLDATQSNTERLSTNVQGPRTAIMLLIPGDPNRVFQFEAIEVQTKNSWAEQAISSLNTKGSNVLRAGDGLDAEGDSEMFWS
ncbi:hypothetical protein QQX98_010047 [Neonectria punicea]|uniref:Uncharacterized protein n=1 Tax=Neonectria punicea TaxID=979145 RepID=A0ABR1GQS4_9HYPO